MGLSREEEQLPHHLHLTIQPLKVWASTSPPASTRQPLAPNGRWSSPGSVPALSRCTTAQWSQLERDLRQFLETFNIFRTFVIYKKCLKQERKSRNRPVSLITLKTIIMVMTIITIVNIITIMTIMTTITIMTIMTLRPRWQPWMYSLQYMASDIFPAVHGG